MRKILLFISLILLLAALLVGCGTQAPDEITITYNGEEISTIDVLNGEELIGLSAVISPSDYEGEITWSSDDAGIVKIGTTNGSECTLIAKKTGSAKITAECGGVSAYIRIHVQKNQENLSARDIALTIHGINYSSEQVTACFADQYYTFIEEYGDSAAYYGLDASGGIKSLAEQYCDYSEDGTWYGYFFETAVENLRQTQALCDYAVENGIVLTEDEVAAIDQKMEALEKKAEEAGLDSAAEYLAEYYGSGVTAEMLRKCLENTALADRAYNFFADSLSYTEEEIAAHYAELGYEEGENDYPVTAMRHILIMAEADKTGECTDEAISAAHEKAEQLYEEWSAGEKTEDSFAALAEEYTDDSGSAQNGGLYENIYDGQMVEGINEWLFDQKRTVGDTAIIDNHGSYVGTHIVYFVGYGDLYRNVLSLDDLKYADESEWFENLTADYTAEQGADYASIGKY